LDVLSLVFYCNIPVLACQPLERILTDAQKINRNNQTFANVFKRKEVLDVIGYDRQQEILALLQKKQSATVKELAKAVFVSEASVRRDLEKMERAGLVQRVYGGVVLAECKNKGVPLALRDNDNHTIKGRLAQKAAQMIPDGATVLIASGSATRRIAKYLRGKKGVCIITNSLAMLEELEGVDVQAYCTGGLFRPQEKDFVGPAAERFLRSVSADLAFFSVGAVSREGELSSIREEWVSVASTMIQRAKRSVCLCVSSNIGKKMPFMVCTKDDVDEILCDMPLPWEKQE